MDFVRPAIPVTALVVNMAVQLLAARARRHPGLLPSVLAGFVAGLVATCGLEIGLWNWQGIPWSQAAPFLVVNVGTYAALSYCFFGFLNLGETSLRIRIFNELRQTPAGLSEEEMSARYNYRRMMEVRLERLVRGHQVVEREGRYFLEGRALRGIAALVRAAKLVVVGKASEFEPDKGATRAAAD